MKHTLRGANSNRNVKNAERRVVLKQETSDNRGLPQAYLSKPKDHL